MATKRRETSKKDRVRRPERPQARPPAAAQNPGAAAAIDRKRAATIAALCLVMLAFLILGLDMLRRQHDATPWQISPWDTTAYLTQAREIREMGIGGWLARCFAGDYPNANQMPLYILFLSTLRFGSIEVIGWAKLISLLFGICSVGATFLVAKRLLNLHCAVLAAAGVVWVIPYVYWSSVVACESLLAIWILLAWAAMARYIRVGKGAALLGALIGLAYMTKGTGLLLLPVGLGVVLWREIGRLRAHRNADATTATARRKKRLRRLTRTTAHLARSKQLLLFLGLFILIASPILVRNVRMAGSPFYAVNQSVMWLDRWEQRFSTDPAERTPTMRSYLESHDAGDVAARILSGWMQQGIYFMVAFTSYGLPLIVIACLRRQWRRFTMPSVAILLIFFLFFTWYPVRDVRFLMPLVPLGMVLVAAGASLVAEWIARLAGRPSSRAALWGVAAMGLLLIGYRVATLPTWRGLVRNPVRSFQTPPDYYELLDWLRANVSDDTTWAMGPSHVYAYPWTAHPLPGERRRLPAAEDMDDLRRWLRRERVRLVVLDVSTLEQRRESFEGTIEPGPGGMQLLEIPSGWRLLGTNRGPRVLFAVFETVRSELD